MLPAVIRPMRYRRKLHDSVAPYHLHLNGLSAASVNLQEKYPDSVSVALFLYLGVEYSGSLPAIVKVDFHYSCPWSNFSIDRTL